MSGLAEILAAIGEETARLGLRWYVFGAQAVAAHGVPRATQDVDVTVMADVPAARRLLEQLQERGIVHRFPEIAEELLARSQVAPLVHSVTGFEVDLVLGGTELEDVAADRAESLVIAGVRVPVSAATDLAISKMIAGRPLDHQDVRSLLASGRVDVAGVGETLRAIERAIGEDGFVAAFDHLVQTTPRRR
ncbi:MAG: hypothetical protein FJ102_13770 [Deltaproteobacteria bacterium]|nr:hypothetical protein [Deltaproteobacteria bacterium]